MEHFHLNNKQYKNSFQKLKEDLKDAMLVTIDYNETFVAKTHVRNYYIAATLNQQRGPVAFFLEL